MPAWAWLITALAMLRIVIALAIYLAGQAAAGPPTPAPQVVYAGLSLTFGLLGALLVATNRDDRRAAWLGVILLLFAVPMTTPLLARSALPIGAWLDRLQPDAFLPAFLWLFVIEFPSALSATARRAASAIAIACAAVGLASLLSNLSVLVWPAGDWPVASRLLLTRRRGGPDSVYWQAVFLPSAAAFVALIVRTVATSGDDRRRLRLFIGGIVAGLLPIVVDVLVEEWWPPFRTFVHTPAVEPWVGLVIFGALAAVPCVTTYSVVVDRVVEIRVVVRAALQYLLARYTILAISALPFVALGVYLASVQSESLIALVSQPRPQALIVGVAAGAVTLRMRQRWLNALDRRFFREHYDAELLLARLMSGEFISRPPGELAARVCEELERSLHAPADLFLLDEGGATLRHMRDERPSLLATATLVRLASSDTQPMDVQLGTGSALDRLPGAERTWIETGDYRLIVAMPSRDGKPLALLAFGEKQSGLPFSIADRRFIATLASPLALAIENERLRRIADPVVDSAAKECAACARLYPPDAGRCACGGTLSEARAPHLLRGVFQFDRRIGAGSMGVVYHAVDLRLWREVAIKTLPRTTPEHTARLEREAQAMASILHPNLAVIYGIETWRGTPFLVEEYLAGGTLADRLARGPMLPEAARALGVTLAGVLGELHHAGIVHCDIKPSNIGFAHDGAVKLLDFGLVHLLRDSSDDLALTVSTDNRQGTTLMLASNHGVIGTPAYMSPEAINARPPTPAVDLWALAVVLYEALAAKRPFEGRDAHETFASIVNGSFPDLRLQLADCPADLAEFFNGALAPDLARRPRNARAFAHDLSTLRLPSA